MFKCCHLFKNKKITMSLFINGMRSIYLLYYLFASLPNLVFKKHTFESLKKNPENNHENSYGTGNRILV